MANLSTAPAAGASPLKQRKRINKDQQTNGKIKIHNRFFYQVLRSVGYDAYSAIPELIDNSLDAKASEIHIDYGDGNLAIRDNGVGMNASQLEKAMDLGSEQVYTNEKIGHFGTGMKSAILNLISEKTEEIGFQTSDGEEQVGLVWKPNESFLDFEGPFTLGDQHPNTGTSVLITNCQKIQLSTLKRNLGCMYYPILKTETVKIYINGDLLVGTDPLYRDSEKTLHNHLTAKVNGYEITIHAILLSPEQQNSNWDSLSEKDDGRFSFSKAGAYVQYGCRYVEMGGLLNVLVNHPKFNYFRFEFTIPKELTETIHLKFNKTQGLNLSPKRDDNQPLSDLIQKIKDVAKWAEKTHIARRGKTSNTPEEELEVAELEKQLNNAARHANVKRPKANKSSRKGEGKESVKPEPEVSETSDVSIKTPKIYEYNAFALKFEDMGSTAVFWDLNWENHKFIITINKGHVFYREFWVNMNDTARKSIAFLLAAMAQSQYDNITEARFDEDRGKRQPEDFWIDFWSQVSLKLRNLVN
jgi:Histidine kinase-, DNA gyrase B-, and HSP90-like ATPase